MTTARKTRDERQEILAREISNVVVRTVSRIESQSDYQAILVKGRRVNHVLHLILSIVTVGGWLLVWFLLLILGGEKRLILSVDDFGNLRKAKA